MEFQSFGKEKAPTLLLIPGGVSIGALRDMEDTVAEVSRINDMLFRIIKEKTSITDAQLNEVVQNRKDWFLTAEEALELGIITEIIPS